MGFLNHQQGCKADRQFDSVTAGELIQSDEINFSCPLVSVETVSLWSRTSLNVNTSLRFQHAASLVL